MKQEVTVTTFNPLSPVLLESQSSITSEPSRVGDYRREFNNETTNSLRSSNVSRSWTTGVCDCQRDEETCWWGCWCNALLQARTTQQFEAGTSRYPNVIYCLWMAMFYLLIVYAPGLAFVVLIGGAIYVTWRRVSVRRMIRQKLGIRGTWFDDCYVQSCCCCCGNCQEAREAKVYQAPSPKHIDFCSGEDLSSAEDMHERAVGHNETSTHSPMSPMSNDPLVIPDEVSSRFDPAIPEGGTCFTHFKLISLTSRMILIGWVVIAMMSFYFAYAQQRADNIVILLLVFVQPFLILYFVYWRARRQHVSIDYVIKCFAVGFWMTPFQAIILEAVLQTIIGLAFLPVLGTMGGLDTILSLGGSDDTQLPDDAFPEQSYRHMYYNGMGSSGSGSAMNNGDNYNINSPIEMLRMLFTGGTSKNGLAGLLQRGVSGTARRVSLVILGQMYSNTQNGGSTNLYSMSSSYTSPYTASYTHSMPIFGSPLYKDNTTTSTYIPNNNNIVQQNYTIYPSIVQNSMNMNTTIYGAGAGDDGMPQRIETLGEKAIFVLLLQKNIFWVLLLLFLNAYVVAAGVEETMKHFVVRCCPFPTPLKDPQSVLIYLVAGALGFATAENIEYVFGSTDGASVIPGTSLFVGELLVLLMRVCMPVHVICSVMQATNLSKVLMGQHQMSLFRIMLPALVLHGTFDFLLFVGGALGVIYSELDSLALEVSGLVVTACMALVAACWAYCTYKKVEKDYNQGWQAFTNESDDPDIELVVL